MYKKYLKTLTLGFFSASVYRLDFVFSLISCIFPIIIQTFMWKYIYTQSADTEVFGYSYNEIIIYTILAATITKLVSTGFEYEMNDDIKNGGLTKYLIRPVSYFLYRICKFIGEKIIFFIIYLCVISLAILYAHSYLALNLSLLHAAGFIVAIIFSLAINFVIYFLIGTICFWTNDAVKFFLPCKFWQLS